MKAAVLEEVPGELVVDEVQIGSVGPREVLVQTVAAGICHSDLHFMEGKYPCPVPAVLGHESAGIVEAVGSEVSYLRPGDHVISCISGFCGTCGYCLSGRPNLCDKDGLAADPSGPPRLRRGDQSVYQFFDLSSFAEQLLVHENMLVKVRPEMPLDKAALIGCGVTTGVGAVVNTARVRPGESVAVIGCGGIGLNAIQAAAIVGAGRVIAVDRVASKLQLAKEFGATDVIDASEVDPVMAVIELTGGGVDHAFEAIGLKVTAEQAFTMLRKGGTATVIGMVPFGERLEIDAFQLLLEKKLQGSNMGSNRFRVDMPQYVEWYLAGRLKLDELVSAVIPLAQINEGFAALKTGEVARQLISFE
ncbi:MAG TPA: Zn-dependent alcohol dehydrogenase [Acidimicrobiia bacterium]|jgi:S-(hydroxymethyl)glutathione dehydrogenase/alcohol dehydrogenase